MILLRDGATDTGYDLALVTTDPTATATAAEPITRYAWRWSTWYATKTEPSFSDMAAKLRRVIIAAALFPAPAIHWQLISAAPASRQ